MSVVWKADCKFNDVRNDLKIGEKLESIVCLGKKRLKAERNGGDCMMASPPWMSKKYMSRMAC
jgi:hypothetical protein